jgi:hypothetical protein
VQPTTVAVEVPRVAPADRVPIEVGGLRYEVGIAWRTARPDRASLANSPAEKIGGSHVLVPIKVSNRTRTPLQVPSPILIVADDHFLQAYEGVTDPALLWGSPTIDPGQGRDSMALFRYDTADAVLQLMLSSPNGESVTLPIRLDPPR